MRRVSIVFILHCIIGSIIANTPTIPLSSEEKNVNMGKHEMLLYYDDSRLTPIDSIRSNPNLFQRIKGNRLFKSSTNVIWLAFDIQKKEDDSFHNYLLQIGNAHIAHYDFFMYDSSGLVSKRTQGDNYTYDKREVRYNNFIHNLPEIKEDVMHLYFRIDQEGQELNFPIHIFGRNYFVQHSLRVKIFHGFVTGLFLITTIVTLSLFFANKRKYFIYEAIVSLASIMYVISEEGYGMMLLWPNSPSLNSISRPLFIGIVVIFSLLFTLDFVQLQKHNKIFKKVSHSAIAIFSVFMILVHPLGLLEIRTPENIGIVISIFLCLTLIMSILISSIALWSWVKEKSTDGMVVFLIFLATLIAILVRLLALQGLGWSSDFVQHTGFITRAIHVPLIGGYLIYTAVEAYKKELEEKIKLLEEKSKSSQAFIERIDKERQRVSMALHDSAGSIITGIRANLRMGRDNNKDKSVASHFKKSIDLSYQLEEEIRGISNDLLPNSILKLGIPSEIKRLLLDIEKTYQIKTTLEVIEKTDFQINNKIVFHLYYMIREALDNIVKYAQASEILVQYFKYEDEIHLLIEDNGIGFDFEKEKLKSGNGLKNMTLRVSWINGTIDIYSNEGTSITINIPLMDKNKMVEV